MNKILWIFLFAWGVIIGIRPITEPDTPWYLQSGFYLLNHLGDFWGALAKDPFSYTADQPWLNHVYLSEIILFLTQNKFGFLGLALWQSGALAVLLYCCARLMNFKLSVFGVVSSMLGALLLSHSINPRGQMFGTIIFSLFICSILTSLIYQKKIKFIWLSFLGIALTQLHGGNPHLVFAALLLLIASPSRAHLMVLLIMILATIVGPFGWKVHAHLWSSNGMITELREWQSMWTVIWRAPIVDQVFILLLLGSTVFALFQVRKIKIVGRFCIFLFISYFILASYFGRFFNELIVVCCMVQAFAVFYYPVIQTRMFWFLRLSVVPLGLLIFLYIFIYPRPFGIGFDKTRFPVDAVKWIKTNPIDGSLFNSWNFGGYLIWALPEHKVFVDGRAFTVYSADFLQKFLAVLNDPQTFEVVQSQYQIRTILLQNRPRSIEFKKWLDSHDEWILRYSDSVAFIYQKKGALN